jgi:hypothetical protein
MVQRSNDKKILKSEFVTGFGAAINPQSMKVERTDTL